MANVVIPTFDFTSFYYPQILEALIQFKRTNLPELTDESAEEPLTQLLRAMALVGHLNNTLTDLVANESTLPTAQLTETVRNMLRLIDFKLRSASPSKSDVLYELATVLTTPSVVIPTNALVQTLTEEDSPAINFEALASLTVTATDAFTKALVENQFIEEGTATLSSVDQGVTVTLSSGSFDPSITEDDLIRVKSGTLDGRVARVSTRDSGIQLTLKGLGLVDTASLLTNVDWEICRDDKFTDVTTAINTGTGTTPWAANVKIKDAIYFGHSEALWDELDIVITTQSEDITGVWEYFDGEQRQSDPDSVAKILDNFGGTHRLELNGLLGASDKTGTEIRVQFDETTTSENVESQYDGTNFVRIGNLGQTSPSVVASDYTVGSDWHQLSITNDEVIDLTITGLVQYSVPQNLTQNWRKTTLDSTEAFWVRFRLVTVASSPVSPVIGEVNMDTGGQFVTAVVTQGKRQEEDPLGSSDGNVNQKFETSRDFFIDGSSTVFVDEVEWTSVENFLESRSTDRHYLIQLGENDRATVVFGDGVTGAVPAAGVGNIRVTYRHNAELDGNVGNGTIIVDKAGLTFVDTITNPRPATGWRPADGADDESLARAKIEGPQSLRVKEVALNGSDAEILTIAFTDTDGSRPFARAKAIEEGFGPKTIEMIVVAAGGTQASSTQLTDLDEHFNGDQFSSPPLQKRLVANQELTSVNFTDKSIDITGTVECGSAEITETTIRQALALVIQPLALRANGVDFEWEFGEDIPVSRLSHEIFKTDTRITKVTLTTPAGDTALNSRELPVLGTVSLTIVVT